MDLGPAGGLLLLDPHGLGEKRRELGTRNLQMRQVGGIGLERRRDALPVAELDAT